MHRDDTRHGEQQGGSGKEPGGGAVAGALDSEGTLAFNPLATSPASLAQKYMGGTSAAHSAGQADGKQSGGGCAETDGLGGCGGGGGGGGGGATTGSAGRGVGPGSLVVELRAPGHSRGEGVGCSPGQHMCQWQQEAGGSGSGVDGGHGPATVGPVLSEGPVQWQPAGQQQQQQQQEGRQHLQAGQGVHLHGGEAAALPSHRITLESLMPCAALSSVSACMDALESCSW